MPKKLAEDRPMKPFERYRSYAADCVKLALSAANDGDKARLLQMSETWRDLAELAEVQPAAKEDDC
jgi:3-dehydroquinate dehydratase